MEKKISKKTLSKSFHHWYYGHLTCFSQEHMQTFGYLTSMLPIIEELYDNKEDQAKALKTYTAFFNTEPQLGTVIVGVTAGLEEARANGGKAVDFLGGPQGEELRESITMLGGIVIGAVAATWVSIKTSFTMTAAGATKPFLELQKTLDGVYPGFLTAAFVILCWYLLAKKKMSPIKVMLLLVVVAFVGVVIGFFNPGLKY